ncbi:MAG: FIST C-terminal domain-containing protein [Betaproteobacteria bacterium]|jgi:hypothetical protein|nr:FIST C-terminal domain-containing protein [Betaproteobacteria bacterium]
MIITQQIVSANLAAICAVFQDWKARWPLLGVMALVPEKEANQVSVLQAAATQLDIPLVGAIFPLLIAESDFRENGVWLVCFDRMPGYFLIEQIQQGGGAAMAKAWHDLMGGVSRSDSFKPTLLTVFDAMVPNIGTIMDEMHLLLDSPPQYAGVNAGSESFQPMPCVFDTLRLVENGVLGLLLTDQTSIIVKHDYPVSQTLMRATSATGNRIVTIDNRPAFEVYQEVISAEYGIALTEENFYQYAVHFPFGVVMAVDVLVRIPVALGESGSLVCVGEIPPDSMLRMLKAPELIDSTCVTGMGELLRSKTKPGEINSVLTFYCAGRKMHFGDDAASELAQLQQQANAIEIFGAVSLGELDSNEDFELPRFHNAAIVCLPQVK